MLPPVIAYVRYGSTRGPTPTTSTVSAATTAAAHAAQPKARPVRRPAVLGAMVVDASICLLRDVPVEVERSLAPLVRVVGGRGRLDADRDVGRRARVQAAADREARRRAVVRSREGADRLRRVGEVASVPRRAAVEARRGRRERVVGPLL